MSFWSNEQVKIRQLEQEIERLRQQNNALHDRISLPTEGNGIFNDTQWGNNVLIFCNTETTSAQIFTKSQWGSNFIFHVKTDEPNKICQKIKEEIKECFTNCGTSKQYAEQMVTFIEEVNGNELNFNKEFLKYIKR